MAPEVSRSLERLRQIMDLVDIIYKRNGEPYITSVNDGVGLVHLFDDVNQELGMIEVVLKE